MLQKLTSAAVVGALSLAASCSKEPPPAPVEAPTPPPPAAVTVDRNKLAAFAPLPDVMGDAATVSEAKVKLGQTLFHDPRLSLSQDISCNSCHTLSNYGVDGQPTSAGFQGQRGGRNSPTVWNAAGHFVQFWDGRAEHVEAQAKGPVLNPGEMAMKDDKAVVDTLKSIPGYADLFKAAFPDAQDPITWDNYAVAVGAFERKLVTPSRFDAYLKGDDAALTDDEKKGLNAFLDNGCTACHAGAYVGGAMYQKAGLVKPWPSDKDVGRAAITNNDLDKFFFKVPSLRNVEKTAPYFHDGQTANLDEAVKIMARHQLGKELDDVETASIVTFLKSLTGELPAEWTATPTLPESGPSTPKPVKG